jgi:hypothetical protein
MEYGEEPHSAADSFQSPLEGDKGIGLKATWNKILIFQSQYITPAMPVKEENRVWQ